MAKKSSVPASRTILIEHGKISAVLQATLNLTPPSGKFVATMTVLTTDGKQHTFSAPIVNSHDYDVFIEIVRRSLEGQITATLPL